MSEEIVMISELDSSTDKQKLEEKTLAQFTVLVYDNSQHEDLVKKFWKNNNSLRLSSSLVATIMKVNLNNNIGLITMDHKNEICAFVILDSERSPEYKVKLIGVKAMLEVYLEPLFLHLIKLNKKNIIKYQCLHMDEYGYMDKVLEECGFERLNTKYLCLKAEDIDIKKYALPVNIKAIESREHHFFNR